MKKRIPSVVVRMARSRNFSLPVSNYNGPDHPNAVAEMKALLSVARAAENWASDNRSPDKYIEDQASLRRAVQRLAKATRHD